MSLQTNLFNSPYAFSEKDDFLTKSMSPMVCSRSEYKVYCYGFTTFGHLGNHFTMVVSNFVCYTLLVDKTVKSFYAIFLAVQDSSISDIVGLFVGRSEPTNNQSLGSIKE